MQQLKAEPKRAANVREGSCVTSIAGPYDGAQLYEGRLGALVREPLFSKENQRPGGLAPPAPGPDGAVGLPDP